MERRGWQSRWLEHTNSATTTAFSGGGTRDSWVTPTDSSPESALSFGRLPSGQWLSCAAKSKVLKGAENGRTLRMMRHPAEIFAIARWRKLTVRGLVRRRRMLSGRARFVLADRSKRSIIRRILLAAVFDSGVQQTLLSLALLFFTLLFITGSGLHPRPAHFVARRPVSEGKQSRSGVQECRKMTYEDVLVGMTHWPLTD